MTISIGATEKEIEKMIDRGVCHVQVGLHGWATDKLIITFLDGPFKDQTTEIAVWEISNE